MSVEEKPDGRLVIKGDIIKYAKELFDEKEYFGAFARIHALIEFWMQQLYERHYVKKHGDRSFFEKYEGLKETYRYGRLVDCLKKEKIIDAEEANRIKSFGKLRDRIIHRLVKYAYQTQPEYMVNKDEVIQGFNEGVALEKLLSEKVRSTIFNTIEKHGFTKEDR